LSKFIESNFIKTINSSYLFIVDIKFIFAPN